MSWVNSLVGLLSPNEKEGNLTNAVYRGTTNMQNQRSLKEGSMVTLTTYQLTIKLISFMFLIATHLQAICNDHSYASQQNRDSAIVA